MKQKNDQILTEWLVVNCQMGEAIAIEQLIKLWYPKLLRYATRILNDKVKAEDAVQSTLETLSRSIGRLKDPASFPKWIYQILNNKCVDLIRSKLKQERIVKKYTEHQAIQSDYDSNKDQNDTFEELLHGLEPKLYKVVHLHYLEGLTMKEIGEVLNVPTGTIKSRLHNARTLINERMIKES
jgi:RNA polymerase sigma-70 factor (ECF subfamily)